MKKNHTLFFKRVAVLGAGVMGAQIAAHFANAGMSVLLYDLPEKGPLKNVRIEDALRQLTKLKPAPFADAKAVDAIQVANYEDDLEKIKTCDLVIEAIAERLDLKQQLYTTIAPFLHGQAILATNSSGLSITELAVTLPNELQPRFCGVHFFNPPRYMHLLELIPHEKTEPSVLDALEVFMVRFLGKGVVRAKDTPNFIANRVGVFSMLAVSHFTETFQLGFEVADALTGTRIGRARSATFRTADVVGLDVLSHVVETMTAQLPNDSWHASYCLPEWLTALIEKGALGQKAKAGVYKKQGKDLFVLDLDDNDYRLADRVPSEAVLSILKEKDDHQRMKQLRESPLPEAQFLWSIFREVFHYSAVHLEEIALCARDVDLALRWGFGWQRGPFEIWQSIGWETVVKWISEDISLGKTLSSQPLPDWVKTCSQGVYSEDGAYSPQQNSVVPRSALSVYQRQVYPDHVLGEKKDLGETLLETAAVRLWHTGDQIGILSFKTKMHTISEAVLDGVLDAVSFAEQHLDGLIIWQCNREPFSAGADLSEFRAYAEVDGLPDVRRIVEKFQKASLALRYSQVPTLAAVRGLVLGGACEFMMHCTRTVAALETYIGLVEVGVGVLPAGGGLKEMVYRAQEMHDSQKTLQAYFKQIAMADVSKSALDAKRLGYLRDEDVVIFNPYELLYVAKSELKSLNNSNYRPPIARTVSVLGRQGLADIETLLVNMRDGHMISSQDYLISKTIADVMCGGDVDSGSIVDEDWLLRLEVEGFLKLAATDKTVQRIDAMLKTGKPLRN